MKEHHDILAERSLIGFACTLDEVPPGLAELPEADIYDTAVRAARRVILELDAHGLPPALAAVYDRIHTAPGPRGGWHDWLAGCCEAIPSPQGCREVCERIKGLAEARRREAAAADLVKAIDQHDEAAIARISATLATPRSSTRNRTTTLERACHQYLDTLRGGKAVLYRSGLTDLDQAIGGGVGPGELIVVGARPGHGKTLLARQWLESAAKTSLPGLIISEEMSAQAIGRRTIQALSDCPERYWVDDVEGMHGIVASHFGALAEIHVAESLGTTHAAVAEIDRLCRDRGVKIVAVDYAQLLRGEGESRYEQVTNTSVALKQAATRNNCTVILLAQLSREIEKRPDGVPRLSDLKESGQLEQDADVILFLQWPVKMWPSYEHRDEYRIYVAKNRSRDTSSSVVTFRMDAPRQTIRARPVGEAFSAESYEGVFDEEQ